MAFAIGVENMKSGLNLGTLLRSAHIFGASLLFTIGRSYTRQASDTNKSYKKVPVIRFKSWDDYREHAIFSWEHIGIEVSEKAISLAEFKHPKQAVYLLGPEDGSLSKIAAGICTRIVRINTPSPYCLNVASAGSIVMYDRAAKMKRGF